MLGSISTTLLSPVFVPYWEEEGRSIRSLSRTATGNRAYIYVRCLCMSGLFCSWFQVPGITSKYAEAISKMEASQVNFPLHFSKENRAAFFICDSLTFWAAFFSWPYSIIQTSATDTIILPHYSPKSLNISSCNVYLLWLSGCVYAKIVEIIWMTMTKMHLF